MSNDTNWPNPERPGVPMFPERDGWHMTTRSGSTSPTVSFWRASEEVWKSGASSYPPDYLAHPLRKYIGPVLTLTQIAEMLAGERERFRNEIMKEVSSLGTNRDLKEYSGDITKTQIMAVICNLGDAP